MSMESVVQYTVLEHLIHPDFSAADGILSNDIALLRVEPVARDTPTTKLPFPICLDNNQMERFTKENSVCYVAGYGLVKEDPDQFNFNLNHAPMSFVDWERCNATNYPLGVRYIRQDHLDNFFCAGEVDEFDSCTGDSGTDRYHSQLMTNQLLFRIRRSRWC